MKQIAQHSSTLSTTDIYPFEHDFCKLGLRRTQTKLVKCQFKCRMQGMQLIPTTKNSFRTPKNPFHQIK